MSLNDLNQLLTFINTAVMFSIMAGTIAAFRYGRARGDAEQFATTLTALQAEIAALKDKVVYLENSNERLRAKIGAVRTALRRRGIELRIEPDTITLTDASGTQTLISMHPYYSGEDNGLEDKSL